MAKRVVNFAQAQADLQAKQKAKQEKLEARDRALREKKERELAEVARRAEERARRERENKAKIKAKSDADAKALMDGMRLAIGIEAEKSGLISQQIPSNEALRGLFLYGCEIFKSAEAGAADAARQIKKWEALAEAQAALVVKRPSATFRDGEQSGATAGDGNDAGTTYAAESHVGQSAIGGSYGSESESNA